MFLLFFLFESWVRVFVRCVVLIVCLAIARGRRALQRIDIRAVSNKPSSIKCNPAGYRMAMIVNRGSYGRQIKQRITLLCRMTSLYTTAASSSLGFFLFIEHQTLHAWVFGFTTSMQVGSVYDRISHQEHQSSWKFLIYLNDNPFHDSSVPNDPGFVRMVCQIVCCSKWPSDTKCEMSDSNARASCLSIGAVVGRRTTARRVRTSK